jgi:hypothetical protein
MTTSLLTVIALTLSAPLPVKEAPTGPPPRVMAADVEGDGQPYVLTQGTDYVPVVREVTVIVMGRVEKRTETVTVPVIRQIKVHLNDKDVQVFGADGKRIAAEDVPKMIPRAGPILVSSDGKPIDPFYLRLLREGAVSVASPRLVVPRSGSTGRTIVPEPIPIEKNKE